MPLVNRGAMANKKNLILIIEVFVHACTFIVLIMGGS